MLTLVCVDYLDPKGSESEVLVLVDIRHVLRADTTKVPVWTFQCSSFLGLYRFLARISCIEPKKKGPRCQVSTEARQSNRAP